MEIASIVQLILGAITVGSSIFAAIQNARKRQYREAWNLTEGALEGMVAAIELLPDSKTKQATKSMIEEVSHSMGSNGDKVHQVVKRIEDLFKKNGVRTIETDPSAIAKAVVAAHALEKAHDSTRGAVKIPGSVKLAGLGLLGLLFVGCLIPSRTMTTEYLVPLDLEGREYMLVVEWPAPISVLDIRTSDTRGTAYSGARVITWTEEASDQASVEVPLIDVDPDVLGGREDD